MVSRLEAGVSFLFNIHTMSFFRVPYLLSGRATICFLSETEEQTQYHIGLFQAGFCQKLSEGRHLVSWYMFQLLNWPHCCMYHQKDGVLGSRHNFCWFNVNTKTNRIVDIDLCGSSYGSTGTSTIISFPVAKAKPPHSVFFFGTRLVFGYTVPLGPKYCLAGLLLLDCR